MSYRIEYRFKASRIPSTVFADGVPRFFVCIEGGDNNCYESNGRNARRARSWSVCMLGTKEDILERTCYFAVRCESEGLQINGRPCTAEQYIKRIRKLVDEADNPAADYAVGMTLSYQCSPGSEQDILLTAAGVKRAEGKNQWTDQPAACFKFDTAEGEPDYKLFFETVSLLGPKQAAWGLAKCDTLY